MKLEVVLVVEGVSSNALPFYWIGTKNQLGGIMAIYAGIGARETPFEVLHRMRRIAVILAACSFTLATGAAEGADQAFAEGANEVRGGRIKLYLPWHSYEREWVNGLKKAAVTVYPVPSKAGMDSVKTFHPNPAALSQGVWKLHARNFDIIINASFVLCWTKGGITTGGTGQGIRIAEHFNIPVYNLYNKVSVEELIDMYESA